MNSNVIFILQVRNWELEWQNDLAKITLIVKWWCQHIWLIQSLSILTVQELKWQPLNMEMISSKDLYTLHQNSSEDSVKGTGLGDPCYF